MSASNPSNPSKAPTSYTLPEEAQFASYRELRAFINSLPPENLDDTVTVYNPDTDEFLPVTKFSTAEQDSKHTSVLDEGHPFLVTA